MSQPRYNANLFTKIQSNVLQLSKVRVHEHAEIFIIDVILGGESI